MLKTFLTGASAAALVLSSSLAASAGGFAVAEIEPEVFVVEDEPGSLGGFGATGLIVGALALAAIAAIASSDDSEESSDDVVD